MIRFLSTRLELKAKEKKNQCIVLYDEPGNFLHIKAHQDILWLFHSLKEKWHQIIYSTHSPSLIDTDNLSNIWLVLNTFENWTTIEDLTTSKIDSPNKQDALQPIAHAMGFSGIDFWLLDKKNVIVEWISDFWYLQAMKIILNIDSEYKIVPWVWVSRNKIGPLIWFCLWYDLDWSMILDDGVLSKEIYANIKTTLFNEDIDKTDKKIKVLKWYSEIEYLFTPEDLKLTWEQINIKSWKPNINNKKFIISKKFFLWVKNWIITEDKINENTLNKFKKIFNRIENSFKINE